MYCSEKPTTNSETTSLVRTIFGNRTKVSVLGIVAVGDHFATLCQELNFYEAIFFFIINSQNEKANNFTLVIILIVKSLQIGLHSTKLLHVHYYF